MRVAAIQHDIVWEDPKATHEIVAPLIDVAVAADARLLVLSEMYATGFSMAPDRIAEQPGGPNETFLVDRAREHGVWMCASVAQYSPETGKPRNVGLLVSPNGAVRRYAKIHPFSYSGEHQHYEAGNAPLTVDVEELRVSLFICYDLRFVDEFWALAHDTDCYVVVANWPESRREHWQALLLARAIENQAYVVGVNRVGAGNGLDYAGDSRIIDPMGTVLTSAAQTQTVLLAEVDPARVLDVRQRFPFLADRR